MYLGIEIGGTKLQAGVCDSRGNLRALSRCAVNRSRGRAGIIAQLEQIIPRVLREHPVKAIGIGFGGPVDVKTGRVVKSHHIAGWSGFDVQHWAQRRFRLPTVVENDANAAALAEAMCGAGKGMRRVFYITVGTGIGGGFVLNGEIYNGRLGAAEIGHTKLFVNGRWRTVESVASGLAIERGVSTIPQAARHLGAAVANMITLLNPDVVIVGGGVSLAGRRFFEPLRRTVKRLVFPIYRSRVNIRSAALGESVVVVGAALVAQEILRK